MKNKEKYGNHNDALDAFYEMCYSRSCNGCPYGTGGNSHQCVVAWLYDDAKVEAKSNKDNNTNNKEDNNEE